MQILFNRAAFNRGAKMKEVKNYMALVIRSQWAAYMECGSDSAKAFALMGEGFTDLAESKNPQEYNRHYVHEKSERSDVTGYSPSLSYSMDYYNTDPVCQEIRTITDNELVGTDAQRDIVLVDLFDKQSGSGSEEAFTAYKRTYSIIPDGKGSGTDALIYTGTIKSAGELVKGKFNTESNTFTADT